MTPATRTNILRILRALSRVPQCDKEILWETVHLMGTPERGDFDLALAEAQAEQLAIGITGALGVSRWSLTDLGKATLAQFS